MVDNALLMPEQALPASARNLFLAAYRLNIEASRMMLCCQIELLTSFRRRLQLYQIFLDDLTESAVLNDTFEVVADFAQNALAEAPRETARLAGIASKMGVVSAKVVRKLADETVKDLGARTCA
ncbi:MULTISPECIES: hypothetical protein [Rhizobium]|nr:MULTISPECIES: hypothetical protein [Rhizobium]ANK88113.1 hypothetical protein AMK02_PB00185 [Rhizobium sp. N731]ANK93887.1 hypothetical protein AMK01_PA00171 [Rhizobium sp. N6212]ANK99937.1 hypothetical protein AMK00_PA00171 [Rhizobium sp. N621]ANL06067.1 hypothetical protein AMJ99_PA00171 [Rhizobium esperanzae]ANL12232.1 hypothetical protein AMJ98_PB00171 [Rhizobium sp. N1341]